MTSPVACGTASTSSCTLDITTSGWMTGGGAGGGSDGARETDLEVVREPALLFSFPTGSGAASGCCDVMAEEGAVGVEVSSDSQQGTHLLLTLPPIPQGVEEALNTLEHHSSPQHLGSAKDEDVVAPVSEIYTPKPTSDTCGLLCFRSQSTLPLSPSSRWEGRLQALHDLKQLQR